MIATLGDEVLLPLFRCRQPDTKASLPQRSLASWRASLPHVHSDHPGFATAINKAGEDLGALRIFDPDHPEVPIIAAGAPWFMTVFGRDSLLTAWMTMLAEPSLAEGVLETLARFQGSDGRTTRPKRSRARSSTRCASVERAVEPGFGRGLLRLDRRHAVVRDAAR